MIGVGLVPTASGGELTIGRLRITAEQGSDRFMSTTSPVIVLPNGGTGSVFSGSVRPFVVGTIPVVGGYSMPTVAPMTSPLREALKRMQMGDIPEITPIETKRYSDELPAPQTSTAQVGDVSIAEIKASQAQQNSKQQQEILALIARAESALESNKQGAAKAFYRMAWRKAEGKLKEQLRTKLLSLGSATPIRSRN